MPNMSYPEVLIVGGGVIGAAIFHAFSTECSTTLVDRARAAQGCTAWSGGIVRCFHDNPRLSDRAVVGLKYYSTFEKRTGVAAALSRIGFLFFPRPSRQDWSRQEAARLANDIEIEWLEADAVALRFGHLFAGTIPPAVYEATAGYMDAAHVAKCWLRAGQRNGGRIMEGIEVHGLLRRDRRVTGVQTNVGPLFAENVVLATGPQTPSLLDHLGIPHALYRQDIQVDLRIPGQRVPDHPAFIDEELGLNGRSDALSGGLYIGYPTNLRDAPERSAIDLAHSVLIEQIARRRFAWTADSELIGGMRSADCYADDDAGMVTPLSDYAEALFVATGFSGGGFKMAPWIASEMKRLVRHQSSSLC
jgi:glycine/D-amino acid oxidase-like deaminating enzyme